MDYNEFKRHIGKAGLTLSDFAGITGKHASSLSNYAKTGRVPDHIALIAVLLGELVDHGVDIRPIVAKVEVRQAKPRGMGFKRRQGEDNDD